MLFNSVSGVCERRLILNWRVDPAAVSKQLPKPFRPRLVDGKAIVGIDVLKLSSMRPTGLPGFAGFSTENAIDRIAVEWKEGGTTVQGLYVPCRYSPSAVNTIVSMARLFPTVFTFANFSIAELNGKYQVSVHAGSNRLTLEARESKRFTKGSVFESTQDASDFQRDGKISYSPSSDKGTLEAIYLKTLEWKASPLDIDDLDYTYIDRLYPKAVFDSALIMHGTKHEWHGLGSITVSGSWATDKEKVSKEEPATKTPAKKKSVVTAPAQKKATTPKTVAKKKPTLKTTASKAKPKKSTKTGR